MAIQDNDPERRNLVMTSLGFIVFYLGEGHIEDNNITLQIINISFNNGHFLALAAWIMLFWFALRYWQTHQGKAIREFKNNAYSFFSEEFIINYVQSSTNLKYLKNNGFVSPLFTIHNNKWGINYTIADNIKLDSNGKLKSFVNKGNHRLVLEGIRGLAIKVKFFTQAIVKKPGFTSYVVPYLIFYAAVAIPAYEALLNSF